MKRILGALLFAPPVIALIYFSTPLIFSVVVGVVVVVCLLEFFRLAEACGTNPYRRTGLLIGIIIVFAFYDGQWPFTSFMISAATMVIFVRMLFGKEGFRKALESVAYTLAGVLWVAWLLGHLVLIHGMDEGKFYIFFLLMVIWGGDTAAYYVGKNLGRRKLAPQISPNKTVEGSVGGLGGAIVGALIAKLWFLSELPAGDAVILGVLLGAAGQLGDLSESAVKRSADVKDSGKIIPGHGGLLDRLDSMIFAAPILYYYMIRFIEVG